ncbi:MAG: SMC-Scp complex subunit ScpB [Clostridiales bacterium]|nr:MAG: SMC-Scp complex subunit ScpB [Clostridiales bacterium]
MAYNQPVTRSSIEFIRGVNSDGSLSKLVELGLVEEKGRLDAPGRPILFGTTEEFLRCFRFNLIKQFACRRQSQQHNNSAGV